jgi:hypothetical protein
MWLWIGLAVLVLGGGAAAALLYMNRQPAYRPAFQVQGGNLTAGKKYDDVHILVETDGQLTPDAVMASYRDTVAKLKAFKPEVGGRREVIVEIVAVPQTALCEPDITRAVPAPADCSHEVAATALGKGATNTLLVMDDPARLAETMRVGVANAVCDFQPSFLDENGNQDLKAICDMTREFAGAK